MNCALFVSQKKKKRTDTLKKQLFSSQPVLIPSSFSPFPFFSGLSVSVLLLVFLFHCFLVLFDFGYFFSF